MSLAWGLSASVLLLLCVVIAVIITLLVGVAQRLHRLHIRRDLAAAKLDEALVGRAHIAQIAAPQLTALSAAALQAEGFSPARIEAENALTKALTQLLSGESAVTLSHTHPQLREAQLRVQYARRFYNDAVADTAALERRWSVRVFRLAGTAAPAQFVNILDS